MPLHILLMLVIGGIAGIAIALHLLGLSAPKMLDISDLRSEWLRHYPDDSFDNPECVDTMVNLRADRGLVRSDQGYGLVWSMGADTSARRIDTTDWREAACGVVFTFNDPSVPRVVVKLGDTERLSWLSCLRRSHGD